MDDERKRLASSEQTSLIDLMAVTDRTAYILGNRSLERRLKSIPRAKTRLATAKTHLVKVCEDILDTVPVEQLKHMQKNLKHVKCHIYIGGPIQQNKDKLEGRWLDIDDLNTVASAIAQCCEMCPYDDTIQQRQCKFKKLMDKLPVDPDESAVSCGWFSRLGRA